MENLSRQAGILIPSDLSIQIIGAGGIGSATAFMLAKMGYKNITVYDFDEVEIHNVNSQFYGSKDLGKLKVDALKENIKLLTDIEINTVNSEVSIIPKSDVVIFAVDSIDVRSDIFKANKNKFDLLIDGRMGGQTFNIYSILAHDTDRYESTLFSSSEAEPMPCTEKAIAYNVYGLASYIANNVKKFDKQEDFAFEINGCYVNTLLISED